MKKILYIVNHPGWFWSHRLALAQAAKDDGWDVHVAVPGGDVEARFSMHGFTAHELGNSFGAINNIRGIAAAIKPDLIHAITLKCAFLTGLAERNVKQVHTIAGLGYLFSGGVKARILRLLAAPFLKYALRGAVIIVQNPDDMAALEKSGLARPGQCTLIRGSGVDLEQFSPHKNSENNPPIVLMPTRLVREKGISVFIDAARILKERGASARCQIAGGADGSNPHAISEQEMKDMVADGTVEWLGKVADMPALYAAASLVVYPSWYGEGIPKVLLEAAACGKAIVTTDHPGCREAVRHNDNGLLVPVKDAAKTADAIEELLQDPQRREKMGARGRRRAEEEFDVKLIVAQTLALYKSV